MVFASATSADESAVIKAGQRVRLVCDDINLGVFTGEIAALGRTGLTVRPNEGVDSLLPVPYHQITKMEVCFGRRGHTVVGAAIGLTAGFVYGFVLGKETNNSGSNQMFKHKGFLNVLIGLAVVGGGIGALIRSDDWRQADQKSIQIAATPAHGAFGMSIAFRF